jgi:hypothetical protein
MLLKFTDFQRCMAAAIMTQISYLNPIQTTVHIVCYLNKQLLSTCQKSKRDKMSLWLCIYAFALLCGSLICLLLTYVVHKGFNIPTQMWHKSVTLLKVVVTIILSCTMTLLYIKFLMVITYLVYAENILLYFACK